MEKHICRYELKRNPKKAPTGDRYMHAVPVDNGKIGLQDLLDEMARVYHQPVPQSRAMMEEFLTILAAHLAHGQYVNIDGLGGLQVTLKCPPGIKSPDDVRGERISVKGLSFKPDVQLINHLRSATEFRKDRYKKTRITDDELLISYLQRRFFVDGCKTVSSKHLKMDLSYSSKTASTSLRRMMEQKYLINMSEDVRHPNYVKGPRLTPPGED